MVILHWLSSECLLSQLSPVKSLVNDDLTVPKVQDARCAQRRADRGHGEIVLAERAFAVVAMLPSIVDATY